MQRSCRAAQPSYRETHRAAFARLRTRCSARARIASPCTACADAAPDNPASRRMSWAFAVRSATCSAARPMLLARRLTAPISVLLVAASVPGVAGTTLYAAESAFVRPQLVAQDVFNLIVALPLLLWSS